MKHRKLLSQLGTHVLLIIACIFAVVPLGWIAVSSLKTNKEIMAGAFSPPSTLHFENYMEAWTQANLGRYMLNSIFVCIVSTLIILALSIPAAYAFARMKFRGRELLFFILYAGMAFPAATKLAPLMTILYKIGLNNTTTGLILVYSSGVSLGIVMMRSFFRQFPVEVEEAAKIDGASKMDVLLKILLPLSLPSVSTLALFSFLNAWNEFFFAFALISKDSNKTLPIGLMVFQGQYSTNYALSLSGIIISCLPVVVFYVLFQRKFMEGMTAGATK